MICHVIHISHQRPLAPNAFLVIPDVGSVPLPPGRKAILGGAIGRIRASRRSDGRVDGRNPPIVGVGVERRSQDVQILLPHPQHLHTVQSISI